MAEDVQPRLLPNLAYNKPFSTFAGGVDLSKPLAKLGKVYQEADTFSGVNIPAKTIDRERQQRFKASQDEFLGNIQNINPYLQRSESKKFAGQVAQDIADPLSETGRTKMNYEATLKLDEEETTRVTKGNIDASDKFTGKLLREAQYKAEGGAGEFTQNGLFMPNEYKPSYLAPNKIETNKIIKSYGEGFESQVFKDKDDHYIIKASSNPTKNGYIRDYFEKWSGVSGDRVKSYVGASLMADNEWRSKADWDAKKTLLNEISNKLNNNPEAAADWMVANSTEVEKYVLAEVEVQAQRAAGLEAVKQESLEIDRKTNLKADPTWAANIQRKVDKIPGITMTVGGPSSKNIPIDVNKTKVALKGLTAQIKKLENSPSVSTEDYNSLRKLKQKQRKLQGTIEDYRENYLKNTKNDKLPSLINERYENSWEEKNDEQKTEIRDVASRNGSFKSWSDASAAIFTPEYGNIKDKEQYLKILRREELLPEKVLDKVIKYEEHTSTNISPGGASNTAATEFGEITVRELLENNRGPLDAAASEYAQENPFSYKTDFFSSTDPKGVIKEASDNIIKGIKGGNFTLDGELDANSFLEDTYFSNNLSWNDFKAETRIGKERLHGSQVYQLVLTPQTLAAKNKMGVTTLMIYPTINSSIHAQVGNGLMNQYASNFVETSGAINHKRALATPVNPGDISSGWRTKEDKQLYRDGLFMEADDAVGNKFISALERIDRRGLENLVSSDSPTTYLNLDDTYDEHGKAVQIEVSKVTKTIGGQKVHDYSYNLVNSDGIKMFSKEYLEATYGPGFKDGIMSVKDLEIISYIDNKL